MRLRSSPRSSSLSPVGSRAVIATASAPPRSSPGAGPDPDCQKRYLPKNGDIAESRLRRIDPYSQKLLAARSQNAGGAGDRRPDVRHGDANIDGVEQAVVREYRQRIRICVELEIGHADRERASLKSERGEAVEVEPVEPDRRCAR